MRESWAPARRRRAEEEERIPRMAAGGQRRSGGPRARSSGVVDGWAHVTESSLRSDACVGDGSVQFRMAGPWQTMNRPKVARAPNSFFQRIISP